jgi:predicted SAM-dependent methyltransferase
MISIGKIYITIYNKLCGIHPFQNILHDEWLALKDLHSDLYEISDLISGKILDVGCGSKPYADWFNKATEYIGIDVGDNLSADFIIEEDQKWPFNPNEYDCIVAFQVFEHIKYIDLAKNEINRVLKPGGIVCLSVPFIAYEHAAPSDYRRYSKEGVKQIFPQYNIIRIMQEGKYGSTAGALLLRWIKDCIRGSKYPIIRRCWTIILPLWIIITAFINICCLYLDKIDKTENYYHNVLLIARKPLL